MRGPARRRIDGADNRPDCLPVIPTLNHPGLRSSHGYRFYLRGKATVVNLKRLSTGMLLGLALAGCTSSGDWRTASRESAQLAPDPATTQEAVLQVYGADAWGWRGWFAIHTWIAAKRTGEPAYKVYDVVGWRARRGEPVMQIRQDIPDRFWFGEKPQVIKEFRGAGVDRLIDAVEQAAREYPWKNEYTVFPGPNSNTFTAWIAKRVPELELTSALPLSAIGKSYVD